SPSSLPRFRAPFLELARPRRSEERHDVGERVRRLLEECVLLRDRVAQSPALVGACVESLHLRLLDGRGRVRAKDATVIDDEPLLEVIAVFDGSRRVDGFRDEHALPTDVIFSEVERRDALRESERVSLAVRLVDRDEHPHMEEPFLARDGVRLLRVLPRVWRRADVAVAHVRPDPPRVVFERAVRVEHAAAVLADVLRRPNLRGVDRRVAPVDAHLHRVCGRMLTDEVLRHAAVHAAAAFGAVSVRVLHSLDRYSDHHDPPPFSTSAANSASLTTSTGALLTNASQFSSNVLAVRETCSCVTLSPLSANAMAQASGIPTFSPTRSTIRCATALRIADRISSAARSAFSGVLSCPVAIIARTRSCAAVMRSATVLPFTVFSRSRRASSG